MRTRSSPRKRDGRLIVVGGGAFVVAVVLVAVVLVKVFIPQDPVRGAPMSEAAALHL